MSLETDQWISPQEELPRKVNKMIVMEDGNKKLGPPMPKPLVLSIARKARAIIFVHERIGSTIHRLVPGHSHTAPS